MFWHDEKTEIENSEISTNLQEQFYKKRTINRYEIKNDDPIKKMIVIIAFIFDINYKTSFNIIEKEKYIDRIII